MTQILIDLTLPIMDSILTRQVKKQFQANLLWLLRICVLKNSSHQLACHGRRYRGKQIQITKPQVNWHQTFRPLIIRKVTT